ncbi:MAG: diguanylate cyclase [Oscillospiraceae bacterium]|nr:diguanylate cyclase [Oscillospiraceae bacterium]
MKIRTMLIISLTVFSLFSMILFTVFMSIHLSSASERRYRQTMEEMSEKQISALGLYIETYTQRFENVTALPAVTDFINAYDPEKGVIEDAPETERAREALEAATYDESGLSGIIVLDSSYKPLLIIGDERPMFLLTRAQNLEVNKFAVMPLQEENEKEQNFELVRYAQIGDTEFYMLCVFSGRDIELLFKQSKLSPRGKLVLICPLQNLLDNNFRGNLDEISTTLEYVAIKRFIQDEKYRTGQEIFTYEVSRERSLALFKEVGDTGWLLGVIGRSSDIRTNNGGAVALMINITIFLGIVLAGLSIFFAIMFTKPLSIIKDVLTKVRRGNHEVRINTTQGNEYGEIAKEFNELLDSVVIGESRHKTIIEMSDNIIFEWSFAKDEVIFSNNFSKKFSYRAPTDAYKDSFLVKCKVHPEDVANYKKTLEKLSKGETIQQDEFRWKNIFGDYVWFLLRAAAIRGTNDEVLKVVGVIVDIDNAKKKEKLLSARANYDALTSLYNRETLEELINNEIDLITARKNEFAILFIDVDDFKFFNDNYSHATGDQVLRFTALSINDIVSNYGMAGRFGGDEFVVCIRNSEINDPSKTAEAILEKLKDGFVCDVGDRLSVNVSIGIAIIRDTTKRVEEIIGMADEAMYNIKKSGKSNYGFIN